MQANGPMQKQAVRDSTERTTNVYAKCTVNYV